MDGHSRNLSLQFAFFFFDREWKYIGTKNDLVEEISAAAGIDGKYLSWPHPACVATKMSWVSRRATSRIEDMAYCTLGLFDVNMPLLYGEGQKAFMRLQLEIIKQSDDESIFAWASSSLVGFSGMLASRPRDFADSGDMEVYKEMKKKRFPYVMTNQGLEFHVPYGGQNDGKGEIGTISIALNCWRKGTTGPLAITIRLMRALWWIDDYADGTWQRVDPNMLWESKVVDGSAGDKGQEEQTVLIRIPQ